MNSLGSVVGHAGDNKENRRFDGNRMNVIYDATVSMKKQVDLAVKAVNFAIDSGSVQSLVNALKNPILSLNIMDEAADLYQREFSYFRSTKQRPLRYEDLKGGSEFLFSVAAVNLSVHLDDEEFWDNLSARGSHVANLRKELLRIYKRRLKEEICIDNRLLRHDEIQTIINTTNHEEYILSFLVPLQARCKAFLVRKQFEKLKKTRQNEFLLPKGDHKYLLKSMISSNKVPQLTFLKKMLFILDINEEDFQIELELQKIREKVVCLIKYNRSVQVKIDDADKRIGSIVRNSKIALDCEALENLKIETNQTQERKCLNDFSKKGQERLEAYQCLFYLLQTKPRYLAKLLFQMLPPHASRLFRDTIQVLFNFSATQRETYLLIQFLKAMLEEEINLKVEKPSDIITGNPLVINLYVDLFRNSCSFTAIKCLIESVLNDRDLDLSLDPCLVYKRYISEVEVESGKKSNLVNDILPEEALKIDEVKNALNENIENIINITSKFLDAITSRAFLEEMPFGIRYITKCLYSLLQNKFTTASEKELLRVISNVLYYRFLSSLIIAPDSFGVVLLGPNGKVTREARSNLGCISKLLHAVAMGQKSYKFIQLESENYTSINLTLFMQQSYEQFKDFFKSAMDVEEPEEYFSMNQFSDETLVCPPRVSLKVESILELHCLLHQYKSFISDNPHDAFNVLLELCGEPPKDVADLLHIRVSRPNQPKSESIHLLNQNSIKDYEVTLNLSNKFVCNVEERTVVSKTALRVKRAIIELIKHRENCRDLNELFFLPITHQEVVKYEEYKEKLLFKKRLIRTSPDGKRIIPSESQSLPELLEFVKMNLKSISAQSFDDILMQIVVDVNNKIQFREKRQQNLTDLKTTILALEEKKSRVEDILGYYREYLRRILKPNCNGTKRNQMEQQPVILKYTAAKLKEKGLLISIDGADECNLKHIYFEIQLIDEEMSKFDVRVKFHRMEIERMTLDFQFLLQLKFEGQTVYKLSEKAKVNVNLLIYLINKKFYRKT